MTTTHQKTKPTLLILEDDHDLQILLKEYYTPRGFNIIPFEEPEAALAYLRSSPEVEVVLCDVNLPQMDGMKFVEKAKTIHPDLPIILMTADNAVEMALQAITAGAYDFVVKPLHFLQLNVSIERAIHLTKLRTENRILKTAAEAGGKGTSIIAKSAPMRSVLDLIDRVALSSANVLISGESGSGKEIAARTIHNKSPRKKENFVAINCSAIPDNLLESELFGYAKGAFTGAVDHKPGLFEEANGGTLFLDEIGDLELQLQAKLLRVIQDRQIKRVGENQYRPIDVRIISATHKDLHTEVSQNKFREDLFYRLNVIPIHIPPLRDRHDDLPLFAQHFLERFNAINGMKIKGFTQQAMNYMLKQRWAGNVRELENSIERAVVLCDKEYIDVEHLRFGSVEDRNESPVSSSHVEVKTSTLAPTNNMPHSTDNSSVEEKNVLSRNPFEFSIVGEQLSTLDDMILHYVEFVMSRVNGVKEKAARVLDVDRKTLYRRLSDIEKKNQPQPQSLMTSATRTSDNFEKLM